MVPSYIWSCLPFTPTRYVGNHIDYVLNQLPLSPSASCPPFWSALCTILWHFDRLCNPDGDYTTDPTPGQVWLDKSQSPS
ncbi:hypothetical protein G6F56_014599 [Rhizopus delemar]|nr:hypothetical protein G6F56_014599 [Rhizopus delemar]